MEVFEEESDTVRGISNVVVCRMDGRGEIGSSEAEQLCTFVYV